MKLVHIINRRLGQWYMLVHIAKDIALLIALDAIILFLFGVARPVQLCWMSDNILLTGSDIDGIEKAKEYPK